MALTGFFCLPDAMPFAYHPLTDPTAKADFPDSPDDGRVTDLGPM